MTNSSSSLLFVSGMFRSGSTLLARMLNTHSKIILASDPLFEFFKSFRTEVYRQNNIFIESDMPLENNFKTEYKLIKKYFENNDFNLEIQFENISELIKKIKKSSELFSISYSKILDENKSFTNYEKLLEYLLEKISYAYQKNSSHILGFKTVWTEQFSSTFLNHFSNGKALFIIRDPRAVVSSNFVKNQRYPLEFLIRQWRKSVYYAIYCSKISNPERALFIRYEDLVSDPKVTISKIINFLDLELEENMLEPSNYKDGAGNPWVQNTSYSNAKTNFNKTSINKWKNSLNENVISFIESSCKPEMNFLGYESLIIKNDIQDNIIYPHDQYDLLAEWIKKFYPIKKIDSDKWAQKIQNEEEKRNKLFFTKNYNILKSVDIEKYFLGNEYFEYLKQNKTL